MRHSFFVFVGLCLLSVAAFAKPPCLNEMITSPDPFGRGEYHVMGFHIYSAQFWTDSKQWDKSKPYALYIKYFTDISKEDFLEKTLDELKKNPTVTEDMLTNFQQKLAFIYPNVADGDSITALYKPGEGVLFYHNESQLGWMKEEQLIVPFFEIWLGEHSSDPELRDRLLNRR